MKTLILGGVRSGKSRLAERLALESGRPVTYIATATAGDAEMAARIAAHRVRRPADWTVIETPLTLATTLREHARSGGCLIVDCLTLWLTNLLLASDDRALDREQQALLEALDDLPGDIVMVGNETGMGIVPLGELTRRYCDAAGRLHQDIAARCDRVLLTVAGLPLALKGDLP
ncbi:bifunctional adenosylcobinamide kinase/adenosylcobinamide-phosphate guanylyltransferase [Immundisolibacter sp.]|uniref:bifunctional adenosylcobinamide kinase/adenosylcobinamide-phosphate guanylyltransferase n=1 Tax=Immundisolibacter sp. TaxID=1934948 RepID=UPI002B1654F1|nr:bifunctional adenosylcobinamide kinase/adenosylcobinamide-phosphate guanylyltransferase [Immundisolibacter sp.]MEA3221528.1 Bifunctional adenosylcobalamin biosynthesis protein CobP [Immundisolibacter sp.]